MGMARYVWTLLLVVISFVGIGRLTFSMNDVYFLRQAYLLIFLGVVCFIAFFSIARRHSMGYATFAVAFIAMITDLIYLRMLLSGPSIILGFTLLIASIGLVYSIFSIGQKPRRRIIPRQPSREAPAKPAPAKAAITQKAAERKKFIASISGSKFHIRKCANGKKIPKKKLVSFANESEAKQAGYSACACVK
jgi:hypothetical protein